MPNNSGPDESRCTSYQDEIVLPNYVSVVFCVTHILPLVRDVWFSYWVNTDECKQSSDVVKQPNEGAHNLATSHD